MCILIYKPAGIELPNDDILKACWENNPHGFGLTYHHKGLNIVKKGFMTLESHLEILHTLKDLLKDKNVILHYRFATQGSISSGNCHPFPVSCNIKDLKRTQLKTPYEIIAHNGIISEFHNKKTKNDLSDTMIFTKRMFHLGEHDESIQKILSSGKFAILDKSGNVSLYGKFIENEGIYYSNYTYEPWDYNYTITLNDSEEFEKDTILFPICPHEEDCLKSGFCHYTDIEIEDEVDYNIDNNNLFCSLAKEYIEEVNLEWETFETMENKKPKSLSKISTYLDYL